MSASSILDLQFFLVVKLWISAHTAVNLCRSSPNLNPMQNVHKKIYFHRMSISNICANSHEKWLDFALFKISQNNAKLWTHLKINMKWKVLELENVGRDLICTFINAIIYVFFFIFLLLYFIALFNFLIFLILVLHFISIPMYGCTHVSCMFELFLYFLLYCKLLSPRQIPWVCKHTIKPFLISDFWFCQKLIRSLDANCCNLKWVTACWKAGIKSSEKICFSLKTVTWNLIMICTVTYLL